jgi:hypothetical protein
MTGAAEDLDVNITLGSIRGSSIQRGPLPWTSARILPTTAALHRSRRPQPVVT